MALGYLQSLVGLLILVHESIHNYRDLSATFRWLESHPQISLPAAGGLHLTPVWYAIYTPVLLLAAAGMIQAGISRVVPRWIRFRMISRAAIDGGWFALAGLLIRAGSWVVVADPDHPASLAGQRATDMLNQWILVSLLVVVAISAFRFGRGLLRLAGRRSRAPSWVSNAKLALQRRFGWPRAI